MTTSSITSLYIDQTGEHAPEIDTAIKWYLETYLPCQIERAAAAGDRWTDAQNAARIDADPRGERDAEKNRQAAQKAADALKKELADWQQNGRIFLF